MINERLRRYGATLATVTALGGVGVAATETSPAHAATAVKSAEKAKTPKAVPDGVKQLLSYESIQKDIAECLPKINKRWNGVLVLHAPRNESALVSFATSPRSYASESADFLVMTGPDDQRINVVVPRPAIVNCDGRPYAVISDVKNGGTYGFLDVKWAEEAGALDSYGFGNIKPSAEHHTYSAETNDLPIAYTSEYYQPQWTGTGTKQVLTSITLPTNIDPHKKTFKLTPSKIMPHA